MSNEALRELAEAASPGPWTAIDYTGEPAGSPGVAASNDETFIVQPGCTAEWDYLAAVDPTTVLRLLDENDAAKAAINEYLDVYECMTQGNYLKGFTLGREPREKLYAAVGREPLPENIPAGWQDPVMELGAKNARLRNQIADVLHEVKKLAAIGRLDCLPERLEELLK